MENKIFETYHKKPIYEGQQYVAVNANNEVIVTTAKSVEAEQPGVRARFQTKSGAIKFVKNNPIVAQVKVEKVEIKEKTERELFLERMSKINIIEQLDLITNRAEFNDWIKRNNIIINNSDNSLRLSAINHNIIEYSWQVSGMQHCCGGREHGNHAGSIGANYTRVFTEDRILLLSKYLSSYFCATLKNSFETYGIISYIKGNNWQHPSYRIGLLFTQSIYFKEVSSFTNPNTENTLKIIVPTQAWEDDEEVGVNEEVN